MNSRRFIFSRNTMSTNFLNQIRKSISSPKSKRKLSFQSTGTSDRPSSASLPQAPPNRVFGSSLSEVSREFPTKDGVPFIVCRMAEYLTEHGLDQEGLFRKNGNIRVMENLRYKFESDGDADLEAAYDVCAVASLMKQFFRELKEPLIPDILIDRMIRVKQQFDFDSPGFVKQLHPLLDELQPINYLTLKYVVQFLLKVSVHESNNKMSVLSLAIVLGPSLFRSAPGMTGLKEQGVITPILIKFIQHSHNLFNRRVSTEKVTHRLLNTSELSTAPENPAPQRRTPPPKPQRKPHLFAISSPPPTSEPDIKTPPQILLNSRPSQLLAEETVSLREVMSPWQSRLKSPASPCSASGGSFKSELQLLVREVIDLHVWGTPGLEEGGSVDEEEVRDTPLSHRQDQKLSVKSLVSQFEDSSVVYGTAFRISDLPSGLGERLKHSASNYDLNSIARGGEDGTTRSGEEALFASAHNLDFLTLERPKGPSRKAPSREGRARMGSADFSTSELDSFFGVDTLVNNTNNSTENNSNTVNFTTNSTINNTTNSTLTYNNSSLNSMTTNSTVSASHLTNVTQLSQQSAEKQVDTSTLSPSQLKLMEELRGVKRDIRSFQLEFRQKNGRKPTLQEKECIRPLMQRYGEIKSHLGVVPDSRLDGTISPASPKPELKEIKTLSPQHGNETAWKYKIEMNTISNTLLEKRKQSGRPAQIHTMAFEQLRQEKRDLQKALLVYEGKYGRPQGEAVIVMRPLYDRYRAVKQFLHKHPDGRTNPLQHGKSTSMVSLSSLHHTENTLSTICASLGSVYPPETLHLPGDRESQVSADQIQQNPSILSLQSIPSAASIISPEHRFPSPIQQDSNPSSLRDFSLVSTLHEFREFLTAEVSLKPQDYWLSHHYIRARKKELKNKLQEFEKEIKEKFDRKPTKTDREDMLTDYKEYRMLKEKMSFLESNFNVTGRGQNEKDVNGFSP